MVRKSYGLRARRHVESEDSSRVSLPNFQTGCSSSSNALPRPFDIEEDEFPEGVNPEIQVGLDGSKVVIEPEANRRGSKQDGGISLRKRRISIQFGKSRQGVARDDGDPAAPEQQDAEVQQEEVRALWPYKVFYSKPRGFRRYL